MEALHDVVRAGKARYIGASTMWAWQFAKAQHVAEVNGWTRFVSMQNHYNLLYREEEREMIPLCARPGRGRDPVEPAGPRPARPRRVRARARRAARAASPRIDALYEPDNDRPDPRPGRPGRRVSGSCPPPRSRWPGCSTSRPSPRRSWGRPRTGTWTTRSPRWTWP